MSRVKSFDGIAFFPLGDVILVLWQSPARVHRARWLFDQVDAAVAEQPAGIIGLQLILPSASPPDGPAREENHARMRRLGGSLRRLVTVPLGDALWMSIVRAVMRALTLLGGQAKSHFVAADEARGIARLLEGASPSTPSRHEIIAGLDELHRALGVPRSASSAA